jgi:hypothetical protein
VDAFRQDWAEVTDGRLAWVFPPSRAVSQALSLIEQYSVQALVVMPNRFQRVHTVAEPKSSSFGSLYDTQVDRQSTC